MCSSVIVIPVSCCYPKHSWIIVPPAEHNTLTCNTAQTDHKQHYNNYDTLYVLPIEPMKYLSIFNEQEQAQKIQEMAALDGIVTCTCKLIHAYIPHFGYDQL